MTDVLALAEQLDDAVAARQALSASLTTGHPGLDVETAYLVQDQLVARRTGRGAHVIGAKLALTGRATQKLMHVDEPVSGWLTSDMVCASSRAVDLGAFLRPRAAPVIGFVLGRTIPIPATPASVLLATDGIFGALEVVDARHAVSGFHVADLIADNANAAGVVVGGVVRRPADLVDLKLLGCVLRDGGRIVATAAGNAALGHPAAAVAWLANELARRGRRLEAGSLALSGPLTEALPVAAGSAIVAEFDGLGSVDLRA